MANLDPEIQKLVDQRVQEAIKAAGIVPGVPARRNRMAMIASKGSMDMAYIPLILSSTAAAMEMEAAIFFTFYGLYILHKERGPKLQVAPLANPAMPKVGGIAIPNIVGVLPGMTAMATMMMKSWFGKQNVPPIPDLLDMCKESGVRLIACQMTMDALGIHQSELIDGVEFAGAGTFLGYAAEASITLCV
jgi:peroxiredoxin family protein